MKRSLLILLVAATLIIPTAAAINWEGPIIFQGPAGGYVVFAQPFTSTQLNYVTGLHTLPRLNWGGTIRGTLGVDAAPDTAVLVTHVRAQSITYTAASPDVATVYIYYDIGGTGSPNRCHRVSVGNFTYIGGITTVTAPAGEVTLYYTPGAGPVTPPSTGEAIREELRMTSINNMLLMNLMVFIILLGFIVAAVYSGVDMEALLKVVAFAGTIGIAIWIISAVVLRI